MLTGRQIKTQLLMKDITQNELAKYCEIQRPYISMLINEKQPFTEEIYKKAIEYINSSKKFKEEFKIKIKEEKQKEKEEKAKLKALEKEKQKQEKSKKDKVNKK
ncbi:helix-turn-helix domain-containing protein [Clostridium brassicae]|uniref:Helix-turn-helix transcriptional regulator n=1 Tax=Clostridium brassicae TaxID=2999072 RepID=A0ABT4D7L3_9CLOT|nr:helix-turn-helix transcriptional regulator [Clostridium brassicae]MCY6958287.1 helix-turn-helix transcriptional regulator [Clostridium brassicae]